MKEMSQRRQQLEKQHEETKSVLQRQEKEDKFLQSTQTEVKTGHKEAM